MTKIKNKVQTRPLTHLKGSMQCDEIERRRSELCIIALIFTFILCEGGLGLDPREQTIENVYVLVSSASPCLPSQVEKKGREGKCFGCSLKKQKKTLCAPTIEAPTL